MTFYDRFELARNALSESIRDSITNHPNGFFDMWIYSGDAQSEFGQAYQTIFKEHFGDYITEEVKAQLWFAGKNIVYAMNTFIKIQEEYTLNELLDFVETFLSEQLDDFENDYECSHWFYNGDDDNYENNSDPV
jgi:hypothetical protein